MYGLYAHWYFALYGVRFVNCFLKAFALSMSVMAVLVPKRMLLFCCVAGILLDSFAMVLCYCGQIRLLVVCYCFSKVKATRSCFGLMMYSKGGIKGK